MKQSPLVQTKNLHLSINFFAPEASAVQAGQSAPVCEDAYVEPVKPEVMAELSPPAIGEYWPGQGGIYAGVRQYPEGLCHVIFAASDAGRHAYGEYGTEVDAESRTDGRKNTAILVNRDGVHPAAGASSAFTCDGHNDFYLPAIAELNHAWSTISESFEKDWYWSSSQRSASYAFGMSFDGGIQTSYVKDHELRVRPVRRLLIQ